MKRFKLSRKRSKRLFRKTSSSHRRNVRPRPMRGGIRA